jgi:hypothetical protein
MGGAFFPRRQRRHRKRMNRSRQFPGQHLVNTALPRDPAEPGEGGGAYFQAKMAFPALPCPGVAGMQVGFINDNEAFRGQGGLELGPYSGGDGPGGGRRQIGHDGSLVEEENQAGRAV